MKAEGVTDLLVGDSDSPLIVDHQIKDCDGGLKPKGSDGNRATQPTTQPSAICHLPSAFLAKRDKKFCFLDTKAKLKYSCSMRSQNFYDESK